VNREETTEATATARHPPALSDAEKRERLRALIGEFDTAMLVTLTAKGGLRARPLSLSSASSLDALYFSTAIDSGKVAELEADPRVVVCLQDKRRFVSVSGVARVERDRALIDRLWSESWRIWFPGGKDDPSLCVLVVEPTDAEYWDLTGSVGLSYAFKLAKGYLTGTRPAEDDERQNAKVPL